MYSDDIFDPNEENDFEYDEISQSEASTINSYSNNMKKVRIDQLKMFDKGFHTITRFNEKNKKVKIEFYESSTTPGFYIRNAISGNRYDYKVGSYDEDLLFKVAFATGEIGQDTAILFYTSPEQYEKHMMIQVSDNTKEAWKQKQTTRIHDLLEEMKSKKKNTYTVIH
jgi:hypothetical protein